MYLFLCWVPFFGEILCFQFLFYYFRNSETASILLNMTDKRIELFIPVATDGLHEELFMEYACSPRVGRICLWLPVGTDIAVDSEKIITVNVSSLIDTSLFVEMAQRATTDCVICFLKAPTTLPSLDSLLKMCDEMEQSSSMLYSDYYKIVDGVQNEAPVIDYQSGSLRNDFDFGSVVAIRTSSLKKYLAEKPKMFKYSGFYQLRLALSRFGRLQHLPEFIYCENEIDKRKSGEKQFDYVNPAQRDVQIEMEAVCTEHLKRVEAWLQPYKYDEIDLSNGCFPVEASVVIPVLNRISTIADAIRSVLEQKTSFAFNILVVDNHSTDGTSEIIDSFSDDRVCHIIPEQRGLGIGGCWNLAVNSALCGRFAIQLDSDDLYSDENTLQHIVDEFYKQRCAMLIGSYRICDFDLNTLPPGVIDHREWTEENGRNNALRINGLGAPRAFYTPVVRKVGFPNVSYGEDYAVGLQISRTYRIGRIYDVLYLCRRWGGNSDAALSHQKVNAHNSYKDSLRTAELEARIKMVKKMRAPAMVGLHSFFKRQLSCWGTVNERYLALESVKTRSLDCGITLQYNPERMVSTAADTAKSSIKKRPCFLCAKNRPSEQIKRVVQTNIELLVNPFPILPMHFTLPLIGHTAQRIEPLMVDMLVLAKRWKGMAVFYNGAKCGASAPDHAHLQAVNASDIPILNKWWSDRLFSGMYPIYASGGNVIYRIVSYVVPLFVVEAVTVEAAALLVKRVLSVLPMTKKDDEPLVNILTVYKKEKGYLTYIFPRSKHRPEAYTAEGDSQRMVSPGLLDMAGLVITPRREDFERITAEEAAAMLREVAIDDAAADKVERSIVLQYEND